MADKVPATKSQNLHEIHPGGGPPRLAPRPPRSGAALRKACARLGYGARRGRPVNLNDWAEVAAVLQHSIGHNDDQVNIITDQKICKQQYIVIQLPATTACTTTTTHAHDCDQHHHYFDCDHHHRDYDRDQEAERRAPG